MSESAPRWLRLEQLWESAQQLPDAERQAWLDQAIGDDDALRHELESLLVHASQAQTFFEQFSPIVGAAIDEATHAANQADDASLSLADDEGDAADPLIGQPVGPYRIEERLGAGGMGVVYRALDTRLERLVALKFLPLHLHVDRRARQRFLIEARAAAALDHTNICTVHEVGEAEGRSFIAMAYYEGQTLKQRLERGPVPWPEALGYAVQITRGLAAAHERGIVHRDVKPANVVVTADGIVKLLDFGIARMPNATTAPRGLTPGTFAYMSPEQLTSGAVDQRADLWALGVLLFELIAGQRPFRADHEAGLFNAIMHAEPPSLAQLRPDVPAALAVIVERLLEKDAQHRFGNAGALLEDLTRVQLAETVAAPVRLLRPMSLRRWSARRARWAAAAVVLTGASALIMLSVREPRPFVPQPPLTLGILPIELADGGAALKGLGAALESELLSELGTVSGIELRPRETIAIYASRALPLDSVALKSNVDYLVRITLSPGRRDSVLVRTELTEGGLVTRGSATLREYAASDSMAALLGYRVAERIRIMLGVRERQRESGSSNGLAVQYRRRAEHHRLLALQNLELSKFDRAQLWFDSASAFLIMSRREDRHWLAPQLALAALSSDRAFLILMQSKGADREGMRQAFGEGITILNSVVRKKPDDPLARAARGRLRWERISFLGERLPAAQMAFDSAEHDLGEALDIDSTLAGAAADLSQLLFARQRFDQAAQFAERALRLDAYLTQASEIINRIARSKFEIGNDAEAEHNCREGLRRFSDNPAHWSCLLDVMAWGSGPPAPDSAWAYYRAIRTLGHKENVSLRVHSLAGVAAVLARSARVPRDSATAVLARMRQLAADSLASNSPGQVSALGYEAAVLFRMADSVPARAVFARLHQRDAAEAKRLGNLRMLREFVSASQDNPAR